MHTLSLTTTQLRVVQQAVENYRRTQGAARMLAIQKRDATEETRKQWDRLTEVIASVQTLVGKP